MSLVGPSGSGKSTVLRVLVGLTQPSGGSVVIDGTAIDYRSTASLKAARDRMAIVFQQYNLFQNMDVLRNVTIAPVQIKGRTRAEVEADAAKILARVGLADKHRRLSRPIVGRSAAARAPSPARWRCSPRSCCSTR